MHSQNVLVTGASFAGLATAFWMKRAGYHVTIVETAPAIREGGTPVNIKGDTVGIVGRMGLLEEVVANSITMNSLEVWGPEGLLHHAEIKPAPEQETEGVEYEIERDLLTQLMFELVKDDVEIVFDDSPTCLEEGAAGISVTFRQGQRRTFDLVFGCDGIHSNIRNLWFDEEAAYAHFLKAYGSVSIVPRLLIEQGSVAVYQEPGRSIILSAYHGKTDVITLFSSDDRIAYDRRDKAQQVRIVSERFAGVGWRVPELIGEIERGEHFYFSDLSQIRMPRWSRGRVALVGDAAYCASAAAGMGGSLAINGADALGKAFACCGGDYTAAFRTYNEAFTPFVQEIQAHAVSFCEGIATGKTFQA